jgi:hypothetical protein
MEIEFTNGFETTIAIEDPTTLKQFVVGIDAV